MWLLFFVLVLVNFLVTFFFHSHNFPFYEKRKCVFQSTFPCNTNSVKHWMNLKRKQKENYVCIMILGKTTVSFVFVFNEMEETDWASAVSVNLSIRVISLTREYYQENHQHHTTIIITKEMKNLWLYSHPLKSVTIRRDPEGTKDERWNSNT